ncbi:MAG: hypothetical protein V7603_5114 [Micromonosporaceae bacterium]
MTNPAPRDAALAALRAWAAQSDAHSDARGRLVAAAWRAGVRNVAELTRAAGVRARDTIYADLTAMGIDYTRREDPVPTASPPDIRSQVAALRAHAEGLFATVRPSMRGEECPEANLLWQMAKLLDFAAQAAGSVVEGDPDWLDVADEAAAVGEQALRLAGARMSVEEATRVIENREITDMDLGDQAVTLSATATLMPPDAAHSGRTLTASVASDEARTVTVQADRGPSPVPQAHTAVSVLRLGYAMARLGEALGPLVVEPHQDGFPLCGPAGHHVDCAICGSGVGADVARQVYDPTDVGRLITVCSVICARAASTGEHR